VKNRERMRKARAGLVQVCFNRLAAMVLLRLTVVGSWTAAIGPQWTTKNTREARFCCYSFLVLSVRGVIAHSS
jgi:hypothetical protein